MIILYSITGIITALFLAIIITGAIRAHRHPERYGPRYTAGRPRQSRARGIARAMLDTIPIVKFGDSSGPNTDPVKGDVEMSLGTEEEGVIERREAPAANGSPPSVAVGQRNDGTETANTETDAERRGTPTPATDTESPNEHPNFSCPICTDDFIKGQDLRVLPCNHQFHPECIDPWLVNVSGTCPLWYVLCRYGSDIKADTSLAGSTSIRRRPRKNTSRVREATTMHLKTTRLHQQQTLRQVVNIAGYHRTCMAP
jgi:hypothetical protein